MMPEQVVLLHLQIDKMLVGEQLRAGQRVTWVDRSTGLRVIVEVQRVVTQAQCGISEIEALLSGDLVELRLKLGYAMAIHAIGPAAKPLIGKMPYLPTHNHDEGYDCEPGCPVHDWETYQRRVG